MLNSIKEKEKLVKIWIRKTKIKKIDLILKELKFCHNFLTIIRFLLCLNVLLSRLIKYEKKMKLAGGKFFFSDIFLINFK